MVTGFCSARTLRRQSPSILQETQTQVDLNEQNFAVSHSAVAKLAALSHHCTVKVQTKYLTALSRL